MQNPKLMAYNKLQKRNGADFGIQPKMSASCIRTFIRQYVFALAIILLAGINQIQAQASTKPSNDLDFMRAYNGKYTYDVKLFDNTRFKGRLRKLLGTQYNYFIKSIWQVEIPIKIENDFLYSWAMQAHSGGDPAATLLADLHTNTLYIEIIKDHKTTLYAEDGSTAIPKPLADWVATQSSH